MQLEALEILEFSGLKQVQCIKGFDFRVSVKYKIVLSIYMYKKYWGGQNLIYMKNKMSEGPTALDCRTKAVIAVIYIRLYKEYKEHDFFYKFRNKKQNATRKSKTKFMERNVRPIKEEGAWGSGRKMMTWITRW